MCEYNVHKRHCLSVIDEPCTGKKKEKIVTVSWYVSFFVYFWIKFDEIIVCWFIKSMFLNNEIELKNPVWCRLRKRRKLYLLKASVTGHKFVRDSVRSMKTIIVKIAPILNILWISLVMGSWRMSGQEICLLFLESSILSGNP